MKIVALIPMRHHSQRVPGKNYRLLAGRPLYQHILTTLQGVAEIAEIVVDTDSPDVATGLRTAFPSVRLIDRPAHLRADEVPMNAVLLHDTAQVAADLYVQTHSTNPLLQAGTIARAIQAFLTVYPAKDSLFSVTRMQARLYDHAGRPINHNPHELLQTQDLPPVFQENSCLYIFSREGLVQHGHRIGQNPLVFEMDADQAWDIDSELDFDICDFLVRRRSPDTGERGSQAPSV